MPGTPRRSHLWPLFQAIAVGDRAAVQRRIDERPPLAAEPIAVAATRAESKSYFLAAVGHYVYEGDTALHIAAAGHHDDIVRDLVAIGAPPRARNRRGAEPLHYAADGATSSPATRSGAQARTIAELIRAGADPNAEDNDGVTPLHRAVRTRSASAVAALLGQGALPRQMSGRGSTPLHLAVQNTGRGGSGSPEARQRQAEIIRMLVEHGARFSDRDRRGKRVSDCISPGRLAALGTPSIDGASTR